jgi:hypothetical protein
MPYLNRPPHLAQGFAGARRIEKTNRTIPLLRFDSALPARYIGAARFSVDAMAFIGQDGRTFSRGADCSSGFFTFPKIKPRFAASCSAG